MDKRLLIPTLILTLLVGVASLALGVTLVNDAQAEFSFSTTEEGATVECSLDGGAHEPCTSPHALSDLATGEHVLNVRFSWGVAPPPPTCDGVQTSPTDDLSQLATQHGANTTFCLDPGATYTVTENIRVSNGDRWVSGDLEDANAAEPLVTTNDIADSVDPTLTQDGSADTIFDATGTSGAHFEGIRVTNAQHSDRCEPNCGRAIKPGDDTTAVDVTLEENENNGIGGASPTRYTVLDSRINRNGNENSGRDGGKVSAAGIKFTHGTELIVRNTVFHDNYWTGVWCDIQCGNFEITDSTLTANGKSGIHYEISEGGATITRNTIQNNGDLPSANQHVGVLVVSSRNAEIFDNELGGNVDYGFRAIEDNRQPVTGAIDFRDNRMNGDRLAGCTLAGVSCTNNAP